MMARPAKYALPDERDRNVEGRCGWAVNLTTTRLGLVPRYIGADLTDGTVAKPRPVDVCGLDPTEGALVARFWTWTWDGRGIDGVADELRSTRCALLDGPQALAATDARMRACEEESGAAGKTPDDVAKATGRVFGGFVRSSVELFAALHAAGVRVSPVGIVGGVGEVYPGRLWRRLAGAMPRKTNPVGRVQRRAVLEACGLRFGETGLSHDQLDAALAALVAAAADRAVPGLEASLIGVALRSRPSGELEEGPMVDLQVGPELRQAIRRARSLGRGG